MSASPFSCPRCDAPAPGPGLHVCSSCRGRFALYAGPLTDAAIVPAPAGPRIQVKAPGVVLVRYGLIDERGIAEGNLDPVIGAIPIDTAGIWWGDIASIAVWRTPAWLDLAVAILVPLPITLGLVALTFDEPVAAIPAAFFALVTVLILWRALGVQARRARVVGRYRTLAVRFDRPWWRSRRFHDELVRRAGGTPGALP